MAESGGGDKAAEDVKSSALLPSFQQRVDFLAMTDVEDKDFFGVDPEHDTVIPDSEFPVALEGLPQGLTVFMRGHHEAGFDRLPDPFPDIGVELRDIPPLDLGMVDDRKGHATPRPLHGSGPCGDQNPSPVPWQDRPAPGPREAQGPPSPGPASAWTWRHLRLRQGRGGRCRGAFQGRR